MQLKQSRAIATTVHRELALLAESALRLSRENHNLAERIEAVRSGEHVQQSLREVLDDVDRVDVERVLASLSIRLRQVRTHQRSIATALSHIQFAIQCSIKPE